MYEESKKMKEMIMDNRITKGTLTSFYPAITGSNFLTKKVEN